MSDYLVTKEYFANSYWGQCYWGGVSTQYAEVFRLSAVLQTLVAAASKMNLTLPESVTMNMLISDTYDELEEV